MSVNRPNRTKSPAGPPSMTGSGILRRNGDRRVRFNFDKEDLVADVEQFIKKHGMPLIISGTSDLLDGTQITFTVTDMSLHPDVLGRVIGLKAPTSPHASLIDHLGLKENEYSISASMVNPASVFVVVLKIRGEAAGAVLTRLAITSTRNLVSAVTIGALVFILSLVLMVLGYDSSSPSRAI